jgi:endonuclease/exonuclease/phosphatase family metal-dependent hydrolase
MTDHLPQEPRGASDPVLFQITAGTIGLALGWVRRTLAWATYSYTAALIVFLTAVGRWGERLSIFSLYLYAPAQVVLVPMLLLSPLCLIFKPRLLGWHLVCVFTLVFGYMNFTWSRARTTGPDALTAVTFNAGESSRPQFMAFIDAEKPDIILLQDARNRGPEYAAKFPGSHVVGIGEFVFISKFPIRNSALLAEPSWAGHPVGARFEIVVKDRPLVVYSIHLPTPRQELSRFIGGRRILGDLVGRSHRESGFGNYNEWLEQRVRLAKSLAKIFQDETQPFIVGGDFNTPDHGYIYHLFAGEMTDAFKKSGRGWGLTFPGTTHNPIAFFGPWLRLDYFFAGRGWRPIECRPEPGRKSQHKAVLARFEPEASK